MFVAGSVSVLASRNRSPLRASLASIGENSNTGTPANRRSDTASQHPRRTSSSPVPGEPRLGLSVSVPQLHQRASFESPVPSSDQALTHVAAGQFSPAIPQVGRHGMALSQSPLQGFAGPILVATPATSAPIASQAVAAPGLVAALGSRGLSRSPSPHARNITVRTLPQVCAMPGQPLTAPWLGRQIR
jgi:hypothetical protein